MTGRRTNAEHAAMSLALVPALPRLPSRILRTVGLLTFAFRAKSIGRMSCARMKRSNGVLYFIGIYVPQVRKCLGVGRAVAVGAFG